PAARPRSSTRKSRPAQAATPAAAPKQTNPAPATAGSAPALATAAVKRTSSASSAAASAPTSAPPAAPQPGWVVEWTRPGLAKETHVWKAPVYGTRETPRRFLGIPLGTRRERIVERYDERVEECDASVGGHRMAITSLAFSSDGRMLASGSRDRTVRVWNVPSGREACPPLEAAAGVVSIGLV